MCPVPMYIKFCLTNDGHGCKRICLLVLCLHFILLLFFFQILSKLMTFIWHLMNDYEFAEIFLI